MADLRHGTSSAYGKKCRCEVCVAGKRARDRDYYLRNQEKIKAQASAYYAENREVARGWQADYRERNAEAIAEQKRQGYLADPETVKRRAKDWAEANPKKRKAQQAKYRAAHRDELREASREYMRKQQAENPDKLRARANAWAKSPKGVLYYRLAAHRRRGAKPDALAREWAAIVLKDPCAYCGEPAVELDHIQPLSAQGSGTWDNLTGACRGCNARKNDQPLLSFVAA